jgi:23S rRNA pseudouridine1911/1915/1917 synthase
VHELAPIPPQDAGERLDRLIAARLEVSRNAVQQWIREGHVTIDGKPAKKSSHAVAVGEHIVCAPPPPVEERVIPEEGDLDLLYEDEHLIAVNKPAGLTVHPGAGRPTGTLAHRLLAHYPEMAGVGGPGRPGIVHRLDKGTSGLMLAARTDAAYRALSRAFAEREVEKWYLAVVYGVPKTPEGRIDSPIGRHPDKRKQMTVFPPTGGREALTLYRVREAVPTPAPGLALLEVEIRTGRTHQIRVHLKSIGHPLVGDDLYGEKRWKGLPTPLHKPLKTFPRPALHAWRLALRHPVTGEALALEAPMPEDLEELWRGLRARSA